MSSLAFDDDEAFADFLSFGLPGDAFFPYGIQPACKFSESQGLSQSNLQYPQSFYTVLGRKRDTKPKEIICKFLSCVIV